MRHFTWLVFSNCDPAHKKEFIEWYDHTHLDDLMRIPGMVSARRLELSEVQTTREDGRAVVCDVARNGARFRTLAIYEFEAEDPGSVFDELIRRSGTPEMEVSPYLGEVHTVLYEGSGLSVPVQTLLVN